MAIYTVHEPPPRPDESAPDPERFVFVRDGFSLWACLLAPLWMLWHRMWLVVASYLAVSAALQAGLYAISASTTVMAAVGVLVSLLVGIEAATMRRFTLARRRFSNVGIVVGNDLESAERRFFDAWIGRISAGRTPGGSPAAAPFVPSVRPAQGSSHVIGLFPEPGAPR